VASDSLSSLPESNENTGISGNKGASWSRGWEHRAVLQAQHGRPEALPSRLVSLRSDRPVPCGDSLLRWGFGCEGPRKGRVWMAVHLEFVILGPPISNQQNTAQGKANLNTWRATVAGEAQNHWVGPLLTGHLKAVIINFHGGNKPSVDVLYFPRFCSLTS
jgi:hypothetical protein